MKANGALIIDIRPAEQRGIPIKPRRSATPALGLHRATDLIGGVQAWLALTDAEPH